MSMVADVPLPESPDPDSGGGGEQPGSRQRWGRNFALDLARVTEGAALAASEWLGDRDPDIANGYAAREMEKRLSESEISGTVVVSDGTPSMPSPFPLGLHVGPSDFDYFDIAVNPNATESSLVRLRVGALSLVVAYSWVRRLVSVV